MKRRRFEKYRKKLPWHYEMRLSDLVMLYLVNRLARQNIKAVLWTSSYHQEGYSTIYINLCGFV